MGKIAFEFQNPFQLNSRLNENCTHDLCCNDFIISHFSLPLISDFVGSKEIGFPYISKFLLTYVNSDLLTIC